MAVIVEDGTSLVNANAYVSQAEFEAYAEGMNWSLSGISDETIEGAIVRASRWIDANYRSRFPGIRTSPTQAMQWPRREGSYLYGQYVPDAYIQTVTDIEGAPIANNAIPTALKLAALEATWREVQSPDSLAPDSAAGGAVKRKMLKAGSVETETEYFTTATTEPEFATIDGYIAPILTGGETSAYTGRAVRV